MLEGIDQATIARLRREDIEFRRLLDEHQQYESQLETYTSLPYLNSEQEMDRKRLQKLKLQGKDRMLVILQQYQ
jgi:uncharacterized protein YdcH (DUF465 family)